MNSPTNSLIKDVEAAREPEPKKRASCFSCCCDRSTTHTRIYERDMLINDNVVGTGRRRSLITEGEYEVVKKAKYDECLKILYVTAYLLFICVYPWWLQAATLLPATVPEYPITTEGLAVSPLPVYCEACDAPFEQSSAFPISLKFNLTDLQQASGSGLVIFTSTDFKTWWVPTYSTPGWVLRYPQQPVILNKGCFDSSGTFTYVVACFLRDGLYSKYTGADNTALGPPFDDRCSVIGSRCERSCGGTGPAPADDKNCDETTHTIPWETLVTEHSGGEVVDLTQFTTDTISWLFILFCLINYVSKILQFSHGLRRRRQKLLQVRHIKGEVSRSQHHVWVHIACFREAKHTVLRTYLACIEGLLKLAAELPGLKVTLVLHEDLKKANGVVQAHWYENMWKAVCLEMRQAMEPRAVQRYFSSNTPIRGMGLGSNTPQHRYTVSVSGDTSPAHPTIPGSTPRRSGASTPVLPATRTSRGGSPMPPMDIEGSAIEASELQSSTPQTAALSPRDRSNTEEEIKEAGRGRRESEPLLHASSSSISVSSDSPLISAVNSSAGAGAGSGAKTHHPKAFSFSQTFHSRVPSLPRIPSESSLRGLEGQQRGVGDAETRFGGGVGDAPTTLNTTAEEDDETLIQEPTQSTTRCDDCLVAAAEVSFDESKEESKHMCMKCFRTNLDPNSAPKRSRWPECWQRIQLMNSLLRLIPEELLQPEAKPDKKKKYWDQDTLSGLLPEEQAREWFKSLADAKGDQLLNDKCNDFIVPEEQKDFTTRPKVQSAFADEHVTRRTWKFGNLTLKYRTGPGKSRAGKGMGLNMSAAEAAPEFPPEHPERLPFHNQNVFFGIIDARHSPTPDFFFRSIPAFFRRSEQNVCVRDHLIRFIQSPQYYPVGDYDDWVDRGGGFYFNFLNVLRSFVNVVTSCGTNAFWHLGRLDGRPFEFSELSLIEDTETSHESLWAGEKSVYINRRTVYGAAKSAADYLAANLRWAEGAVELFGLDFRMHVGLSSAVAIFIAVEFCMIVLTDKWSNYIAVAMPALLGLFWTVLCHNSDRVHYHVVLWANTWYWFMGIVTALFWVLFLPGWLAFHGGFPFNNVVMLFGLGVSMGLEWILTSIVQTWAGANSEVSLWRNFQVWIISWSMLIMAAYKGIMRQNWPTKMDKMGGWDKSATFTNKVLPALTILQATFHASAVGYCVYNIYVSKNVDIISNSHLAGLISNLIYFVAMPLRVVWGQNPLTLSMRHISMFTVIFGLASVCIASGGYAIYSNFGSFWNIF